MYFEFASLVCKLSLRTDCVYDVNLHVETEEQWLEKQARFLKEHLLVWGPAFAQEVESAKHADFYKGAGKLLRGFLELEKQLFHDRGPEKIETLQTLRNKYGSRREWKGPLFEPVPENKADS